MNPNRISIARIWLASLIVPVVALLTISATANADPGGGGGGLPGGGGPIVTGDGGGGSHVTLGGATGGGGGGGGPQEVPLQASPGQDTTSVGGNGDAIVCTAACAPNLMAKAGVIPNAGAKAIMPVVDIATAVQVAVTALQIQPIVIGITPTDQPVNTGLVGLPTWLWVKNPSENTIGPIHRLVTTGGVTVQMTAVLTSIWWTMGDGSVFPCAGPPAAPYTPYTPAFLNAPSPTCGYFYTRSSIDQPDNSWTVTATSAWLVFWSVATPGGTAAGVIPLAPTAHTQIRTGESQVLVVPGG